LVNTQQRTPASFRLRSSACTCGAGVRKRQLSPRMKRQYSSASKA
jgi:hypothetical protein